MGIGRIGADDNDDVGVLDRIEVLRAGRGAVGLGQAIAGRRMADARAGIDVVVAERRRAPASAPGTSLRWCSATR